MEVLIAVCSLMGIETGVDVAKITDVAEDLVVPDDGLPDPHRPRRAHPRLRRRMAPSRRLFAKAPPPNTARRPVTSLVELGRRGMVGGQKT